MRARVKWIAGLAHDEYAGETKQFERIEGELSHTGNFDAAKLWTNKLRLFAGASHNAPEQRSIGLASLDVTDTYTNDYVRGRDALFARPDVHFAVPGGVGLRGYSPLLLVDRVAALNGELTRSVVRLAGMGVEVFLGDVRRLEDVSAAAEGMDVIVHMAAGMKGSSEFMVDSCVRGTQNVAEAAARQKVKRVIYMSSLSVYDYSAQRSGADFSETSPLEPQAESRGAYSLGKRRAEDIALAHLNDPMTPWTILRPSLIVGGSSDILSPVGSKVGNNLLSFSSSRKRLALVHVEDVATAILQVLSHPNTQAQIYVLSDPDHVTVRQYVKACVRNRYPGLRVLNVPYVALRSLGLMATLVKKITGFGRQHQPPSSPLLVSQRRSRQRSLAPGHGMEALRQSAGTAQPATRSHPRP